MRNPQDWPMWLQVPLLLLLITGAALAWFTIGYGGLIVIAFGLIVAFYLRCKNSIVMSPPQGSTHIEPQELHQGPLINRIAVGGGIMGAVFAVGTCLMFFFGVWQVRWFLLLSLPLGLCIAALLYVYHKRRPVELTGVDEETRLKLD